MLPQRIEGLDNLQSVRLRRALLSVGMQYSLSIGLALDPWLEKARALTRRRRDGKRLRWDSLSVGVSRAEQRSETNEKRIFGQTDAAKS